MNEIEAKAYVDNLFKKEPPETIKNMWVCLMAPPWDKHADKLMWSMLMKCDKFDRSLHPDLLGHEYYTKHKRDLRKVFKEEFPEFEDRQVKHSFIFQGLKKSSFNDKYSFFNNKFNKTDIEEAIGFLLRKRLISGQATKGRKKDVEVTRFISALRKIARKRKAGLRGCDFYRI